MSGASRRRALPFASGVVPFVFRAEVVHPAGDARIDPDLERASEIPRDARDTSPSVRQIAPQSADADSRDTSVCERRPKVREKPSPRACLFIETNRHDARSLVDCLEHETAGSRKRRVRAPLLVDNDDEAVVLRNRAGEL